MIANGDMVGVVACWRGTYKGPFFGIEPTGREVEMRGIVLWRIAEGQLAERFTTTGIWAVSHNATLTGRRSVPAHTVRSVGFGLTALRDRGKLVSAVEDPHIGFVHTQEGPKVTGGCWEPVCLLSRVLRPFLLHEDRQRAVLGSVETGRAVADGIAPEWVGDKKEVWRVVHGHRPESPDRCEA